MKDTLEEYITEGLSNAMISKLVHTWGARDVEGKRRTLKLLEEDLALSDMESYLRIQRDLLETPHIFNLWLDKVYGDFHVTFKRRYIFLGDDALAIMGSRAIRNREIFELTGNSDNDEMRLLSRLPWLNCEEVEEILRKDGEENPITHGILTPSNEYILFKKLFTF